MKRKDYGDGTESFSMNGDEALKFLDGYIKGVGARDLVNEGAKLFQSGDFAGAEAKFKDAIRENPHNAVAHGNIGNIYFKRGKYNEAIPWLEKAHALDPMLSGIPECLQQCRTEIALINKLNPTLNYGGKPTHAKKWWMFWR